MTPFISDLRSYAAKAPSLPADQNRVEVRMYASVTALLLVLLMIEPTVYLAAVPDAIYARTMRVSRVSFDALVCIHIFLALTAIPYLLNLLFLPTKLRTIWPRSFACVAAFAAACMWLYAATLSYPLDYGLVWVAYLVRSLVLGGIAFILGWSVNAQHLREAAASVY